MIRRTESPLFVHHLTDLQEHACKMTDVMYLQIATLLLRAIFSGNLRTV